jgi:alpha-ribazole phosphatase
MLRLLLARHGETELNGTRRFQGHRDPPLSDHGRIQAERLAAVLQKEPIDAIHASDLRRARRTAERIGAACGVSCRPWRALRELSFGGWEGRTFAEIERADPERAAAWVRDPASHSPPGGETLERLRRRVTAFRCRVERDHAEQTVLVVAHGGPLRVLMSEAMGLPPDRCWRLEVAPGSLSELHLHPEDAVLARLNHVPAAEASPEVNPAAAEPNR